jgi:ABC-type nitrate/sulfonate/bicarbonate transport system substrate-binding protein
MLGKRHALAVTILVALSGCGGAAAPASSPAPAAPASSQAAAPKPASAAASSAAAGKPAASVAAAAKPSASASSGGSAENAAAAKPPASASGSAKPLGSFKLGASAINSMLLPIQLGVQYGLYAKYGATVEFAATGVGNTTVAAMESGEVAGAFINPSNVAEAVAAGSQMRSVMSIGVHSSYLLVVSPTIGKVEDLKGKAFAIANPGGLASNVAEAFLDGYGLKNGQNVSLINLGAEPSRIQAVQSGQVQGTIINPAFRDKIGSLKVLLDLRDLDIGFPGGALALSGKVLRTQPDAAEALVKGTWDGINLVVDPSQKDKVLGGLRKYLQLDADQAGPAYNELQKDLTGALPPKLDPKGVTKSIEFLARSNPSVGKLTAQDVLDSSIVDKLIAQGFK